MRSLRARLTFAYASLFALALCVVAILGTRLEFEALAHPTLDATETSVRIAETIVAAHRLAPAGILEGEIATEAQREGVVVRIPPPNTGLGGGQLPDRPRGMDTLSVESLLGLRPHLVQVGADTVSIGPDLRLLRPALNACVTTLAVSVVLAVALAWAVARWITGLAISPLLTVTAELRRFAGGDFTPREVRTTDREELGALIDAYNGATAKVAAAFAERRHVEEHMRRFVADAGHELRTPLTVIDGYLQILRKASPDDFVVRERAHATLQAQTARMRTLVERLMVLARLERPESLHADEIDVATIAADAIAGVMLARGGRIALEAAPAPRVTGDAVDVHEAIGNLVDNAVKYGAGSDVLVTLAAADDAVVVRVRDGGPGIPLGERERIFERFYRGDERGDIEGSGLGLAIVERAVARCGGRVVLERADPGETTFALELPASRTRRHDVTPLRV